jgi:hypothetical protein
MTRSERGRKKDHGKDFSLYLMREMGIPWRTLTESGCEFIFQRVTPVTALGTDLERAGVNTEVEKPVGKMLH